MSAAPRTTSGERRHGARPRPTEPALVASGLHKAYRATKALDGASLTLFPGTLHALVGPNGAGKSTLVKILAGAVRPDAGTLLANGTDEHAFHSPHDALRAGIHVVHQDPQGFAELSVADNVLVSNPPFRRLGPARLRSRDLAKARTAGLLRRIGLELDPATPLRNLSLADRTLVQICRALAEDMRVLILDEPTAALGQDDSDRVYNVCHNLREHGVAVLVVTHRLHEVVRHADRVTALRDGRVIADVDGRQVSGDSLVELVAGGALPPVMSERTTDGSPPLLRVRQLHGQGFDGPVDLDVAAGEAVALTGLPGSGAAECLRALGGATATVAGSIHLHTTSEARAGIGFVPADRKNEGIFPELSVRDNIVIGALRARSLMPLRRRTLDRQAKQLIDRLGIRPALPTLAASRLSGGNQQKVLLARWILAQRAVLVLEEPTNGLDVGAKRDVHDLLRGYLEEGGAIVALSSEEQEAVSLAGRVAVFRDRRLVTILPADVGATEILLASMPTLDASSPEDAMPGGEEPR